MDSCSPAAPPQGGDTVPDPVVTGFPAPRIVPLQGRGRRFESVNAHEEKYQVKAGFWPLSEPLISETTPDRHSGVRLRRS